MYETPSASMSGDEEVVVTGHLAHEHERGERHVGDAAVEGAHAHQREGAGIDAGILEEERGRASEGAAEEAADGERRGEVARAAARADGEGGGEQLGEREEQEELHGRPAAGHPRAARDRHLHGAVAAAEEAEALAGLLSARPTIQMIGVAKMPSARPPNAGLVQAGSLRRANVRRTQPSVKTNRMASAEMMSARPM
jgi:hypothetical protein